MRFSFLIILSYWGILSAVPAQAIRFTGEELILYLHDNEVELRGIYSFDNTSADTQRSLIKYPFKVTDRLPYPDSIEIYDNINCKGFLFSKTGDAAYFTICIPPGAKNFYEIYYRQKAPERHFEYILTSTKNWGRGLDSSVIEINVPTEFRITRLSYDIELMEEYPDKKIYRSTFKDFMPGRDLIVDWARGTK